MNRFNYLLSAGLLTAGLLCGACENQKKNDSTNSGNGAAARSSAPVPAPTPAPGADSSTAKLNDIHAAAPAAAPTAAAPEAPTAPPAAAAATPAPAATPAAAPSAAPAQPEATEAKSSNTGTSGAVALANPPAEAGRIEGKKEGSPPTAIAHIQGAGDNKDKISGTVSFIQQGDGVEVIVDVKGLTPGKHGFHIHEKPDLSDPELKTAGGHWNPDGHQHGNPAEAAHHAGDMGNLTADDSGNAKETITLKGINIAGDHGVVGHSIIIHGKADDLKSQPAGDAGARIAGGVIEAKPGDGEKK